MENCIFCKIAKGQIPCEKVYEDKNCLAFLDIKPHAKGHTVVIPKKHGETVFDLGEETLKNVITAVTNAMKKINDVFSPDGFNVGWNHNTAAGQVVPHLHVHIFPRYIGDGGGSMHSIINNPGTMPVQEVARLLRN